MRRTQKRRAPQRVHRPDLHAATATPQLAPATHLSFPDLVEVRTAFARSYGDADSTKLCLAMVEAGLADPIGWKGRPAHFLEAVLKDWIADLAGPVRHCFDHVLRLTRSPGDPDYFGVDVEPAVGLNRYFLQLWPEHGGHYAIKLDEPIAKLESVDRRFPSMVWQRLVGALHRIGMEVWDPFWAKEDAEWGWSAAWYDEYDAELEANGPENVGDRLERPESVIPKSLLRKPVKDETVRRALLDCPAGDMGNWAHALLVRSLEIRALAKDANSGWRDLTEAEKAPFEDAMGQAPSLVAFMHVGDPITHIIDMHGDSIQQSGEPLVPMCCWGFQADPQELLDLHAKLKRTCAVLRKATEILLLLDNPGQPLPLAVSLNL